MHGKVIHTESLSLDGYHDCSPPSPLHDDLLAILQREQSHALSLLNSSPFLASLLIAYSRDRDAMPASSTNALADSVSQLEALKASYSSFQADYTHLSTKWDQAQHQHVKDTENIETLKTNLNYFTTAYSESKGNHERTLRDRDDLKHAYRQLQEDHERVSNNEKNHREMVEALVADWNAQCDTFNQSAADRQQEHEDYKRKAVHELEETRMEVLEWRTRYNQLNESSSRFQAEHQNCEKREDFPQVRSALDRERVHRDSLTQSLTELREKHDDLQWSHDNIRERHEYCGKYKAVDVARWNEEDVIRQEVADTERKHRQELDTLENQVSEFQYMHHGGCEDLRSAQQRTPSLGTFSNKSHEVDNHNTQELTEKLNNALAELSQWKLNYNRLIRQHAADIEVLESQVSELGYHCEEKCEELRGTRREYQELQSLVDERTTIIDLLRKELDQEKSRYSELHIKYKETQEVVEIDGEEFWSTWMERAFT